MATIIRILFFASSLLNPAATAVDPDSPTEVSSSKTVYRLGKPLVGDDNRVYACSKRNFFAFASNGTIAWSVHLNFTCNAGMAPVHGGRGTIYLVAENRVLKINFLSSGTSESGSEVFFGPKPGLEEPGDIIGLSVSAHLASVFVNVKHRGLFAFTLRGQLIWGAGPVLDLFGYRQGCKKNVTDCYFSSVPVIDLCEASVYIANTAGELYSISVRTPHFRWIQDFSTFDKIFIVTSGNNGRLFVTIPVRALVFALDVFTGYVFWQSSVGPLSTSDCDPVVDSNGWISIGSLDGFLYSISPTGEVNKFPRAGNSDFVIQHSPLLDCSGYAVYVAQTEMDGKVTRTISDYTYISALKPRKTVFTMLAPVTGSFYWSESYPGRFSYFLSDSDLHHFVLDERILLAFITASKIGNPLLCRTTCQKLEGTCSQAKPKQPRIYTGHERAILLFLIFESAVLIILAGVVRFCFLFWRKKKLQGQNLGDFLEKRRSLQLKKKAFNRTITELEQKAAEEAASNEMLEELSSLVQEREGVKRKLSTTYSLGQDTPAGPQLNSLLPLYDGSWKSSGHSFQGRRKESVSIFHTLSATSSSEGSSRGESSWESYEDSDELGEVEAKGKKPIEVDSPSTDDKSYEEEESHYHQGDSSSLKGLEHSLSVDQVVVESKRGEGEDAR